jgi:hypothetical protein
LQILQDYASLSSLQNNASLFCSIKDVFSNGALAEKAYVWVFRIPCYDGVFDYEGKPLDEDNIVVLDLAKVLLGGKFQI